MALERTNPLPVGRYWIDVNNSKTDEFNAFMASHKGSARVEVTEGDGSEEATEGNTSEKGGTTFYIFTVSKPFTWLSVNFGFPTIAGPNIKSKSDTIQSPDLPKNALDELDVTLTKIGGFAMLGLGILGLGLIAKVLTSNKKE
jgi:hypothetical protein